MIPLTEQERDHLKRLLLKMPQKSKGYHEYREWKDGHYRTYKRARVIMQLHLGMKFDTWEIVRHIDGNKLNDSIDNLEILNHFEWASKNHRSSKKKPKGWKPANTLRPELITRINEIASEMVKINCSEIARRMEREGTKVCSFTVKRYVVENRQHIDRNI